MQAANVARDGEVVLSAEDFTYMVEQWTEQMRAAALADEGDRLELINLELAGLKVARQADKLVTENPDLRNDYESGLRAYKRNFVLKQFEENIEYPDVGKLARERYKVEKDKYALIPERRLSSHILLSSPPGLPREEKLELAEQILVQLKEGADWLEMVKEYSQEPNAEEKQGLYNYWMTYGDQRVSPPYSEAVFSIGEVGEFAAVTQTQFGVHIIKLEGVREQSYKTFEEVKPVIVKEIKGEYKKLALKEYLSQFNMSDDAVVDDEAVLEILSPYAAEESAPSSEPVAN